MDDVPYEFIERVFAKLSYSTIHEMELHAPLWEEVARVHVEKLHPYECTILPTGNGLCYGFYREDEIMDEENEETMTLEDFAKLDWRYHRVVELWTISRAREEKLHPVGGGLAEIVEFVSQFNLECISAAYCGRWADQEVGVVNECCEHDLQTEKLIIDGAYEAFLLKQLKNDRLETLNQRGRWDEPCRPQLEAFVCRPNFKELHSTCLQCFDLEGIERILAYWRSMEAPWKWARITVNLDLSCEEVKKEMAPIPTFHGDQFVEFRGDFKAVVYIHQDIYGVSQTKLMITFC